MGSRLGSFFLCCVGLLLVPAGAGAAERWARPDSTLASGACSAAAPCELAYAVESAVAGDEVVVTPGTYRLNRSLEPTEPIELRGVLGQPRPRLVGSGGTTVLNFKAGGSLRHMAIEATGSGQDALTLRGGLGEDLLIRSTAGDGGKVNGDTGGTVLRDSVVWTSAMDESFAGLKIRDSGSPGDVSLLNVTVMAVNGFARGIRCELSGGQARIVNAIVRGASADIDASSNGANCTARSSNFRALLSPGLVAGSGNQQGSPLFVDASNGDLRPLPASPTVDAGSLDALLGAIDPAGCSRMLGGAPDIGAYEFADPAAESCAWTPPEPPFLIPALPSTGDPEIDRAIRGIPAPVLGRTVVVNPGAGRVLVRRPAGPRFRVLDEPARLPVGSTIDARTGAVQLITSVGPGGRLQAGRFWGSRFEVRQRRGGRGMTSLILRGGNFARCSQGAARGGRRLAGTSAVRRIRRLWGRDRGGRFRTFGRHSHATVRGTRWLTEDRCDGTLTRVTAGAVAVRDRLRGKTVIVRAGRSYLTRAHRRR